MKRAVVFVVFEFALLFGGFFANADISVRDRDIAKDMFPDTHDGVHVHYGEEQEERVVVDEDWSYKGSLKAVKNKLKKPSRDYCTISPSELAMNIGFSSEYDLKKILKLPSLSRKFIFERLQLDISDARFRERVAKSGKKKTMKYILQKLIVKKIILLAYLQKYKSSKALITELVTEIPEILDCDLYINGLNRKLTLREFFKYKGDLLKLSPIDLFEELLKLKKNIAQDVNNDKVTDAPVKDDAVVTPINDKPSLLRFDPNKGDAGFNDFNLANNGSNGGLPDFQNDEEQGLDPCELPQGERLKARYQELTDELELTLRESADTMTEKNYVCLVFYAMMSEDFSLAKEVTLLAKERYNNYKIDFYLGVAHFGEITRLNEGLLEGTVNDIFGISVGELKKNIAKDGLLPGLEELSAGRQTLSEVGSNLDMEIGEDYMGTVGTAEDIMSEGQDLMDSGEVYGEVANNFIGRHADRLTNGSSDLEAGDSKIPVFKTDDIDYKKDAETIDSILGSDVSFEGEL